MGGGDYAKNVCQELGIENLFLGFLPKPHICIDDQNLTSKLIHPNELESIDIDQL